MTIDERRERFIQHLRQMSALISIMPMMLGFAVSTAGGIALAMGSDTFRAAIATVVGGLIVSGGCKAQPRIKAVLDRHPFPVMWIMLGTLFAITVVPTIFRLVS